MTKKNIVVFKGSKREALPEFLYRGYDDNIYFAYEDTEDVEVEWTSFLDMLKNGEFEIKEIE